MSAAGSRWWCPGACPGARSSPSWPRSGPGSSARCGACARPRPSGPPARLEDGGQVPYLGEMLLLRVRVEPGRTRAHVARRGEVLVVKVAAGPGTWREALERWYRRQARAEIEPRLDAAAAAGRDAATPSCSIRAQRTRWASCSSSGAMSFNWRLLLAPPAILDYVVEHEVCHLTVHDHSRRFWNLLGRRDAGLPRARALAQAPRAVPEAPVGVIPDCGRAPRGEPGPWTPTSRTQHSHSPQPPPAALPLTHRPRARRRLRRPRPLPGHRRDRPADRVRRPPVLRRREPRRVPRRAAVRPERAGGRARPPAPPRARPARRGRDGRSSLVAL